MVLPSFISGLYRRRASSALLGLAILGAATAFLADGEAGGEAPERGPEATSARPVTAGVATSAHSGADHRFHGTTRAADYSVLSFTVGGRMQRRAVEVGQRVKAGAALAHLDGAPFEHAVRATEAALVEQEAILAQRERDRRRAEELFADDAIAKVEVENARTGLDAVRAGVTARSVELSEARRQLSETVLRAPFDGQVLAVHLEPGEFAMPGATVVELGGEGGVELEVDVPETEVSHLRAGAKVEVRLPMIDRTVAAEVLAVGGSAPNRGRLFPVRISLDAHPAVRPGMAAELIVPASGSAGLTVPLAALRDPSGRRPVLFKIAGDDGGDRAVRVPVEVGALIDDRIEIRGDVTPGERVIVGGHAFLLDGDAVRVESR